MSSSLGAAEAERLPLRSVTYEQEVEAISVRMGRSGDVTTLEYLLLVHKPLVKDLESQARGNDLTFLDVFDALDEDRHYLLSWVHLWVRVHPSADEIIAGEFSRVILRDHCGKALRR